MLCSGMGQSGLVKAVIVVMVLCTCTIPPLGVMGTATSKPLPGTPVDSKPTPVALPMAFFCLAAVFIGAARMNERSCQVERQKMETKLLEAEEKARLAVERSFHADLRLNDLVAEKQQQAIEFQQCVEEIGALKEKLKQTNDRADEMQRRHILSEEEIGALKMKFKEAEDREEEMQKNINVMAEEIQRLKEEINLLEAKRKEEEEEEEEEVGICRACEKQGELSECQCGDSFCDECLNTCEGCGDTACNECSEMVSCIACDCQMCEDCMTQCGMCEEPCCEDCREGDEWLDEAVCESCMEDYRSNIDDW